MSEPVRIKITPDSKMIEIPIHQYKEYRNRVLLEVMFDVYTSGRTEEEAEANAESIIEWVARALGKQLENADGVKLPSPSECRLAAYGVRNIETEEREDDE